MSKIGNCLLQATRAKTNRYGVMFVSEQKCHFFYLGHAGEAAGKNWFDKKSICVSTLFLWYKILILI